MRTLYGSAHMCAQSYITCRIVGYIDLCRTEYADQPIEKARYDIFSSIRIFSLFARHIVLSLRSFIRGNVEKKKTYVYA